MTHECPKIVEGSMVAKVLTEFIIHLAAMTTKQGEETMLQSKDTSLKPRHELGDKFTLLFEGGKSWPPLSRLQQVNYHQSEKAKKQAPTNLRRGVAAGVSQLSYL